MGYANIDMKDLRNKKKITNFDILSQITPPISLKYKTKLFEDGEDAAISNNVLEINNGKYLRGQADKGVFASGTKGILNRICNDFGNIACSNYIDDLQQVITEYMKTSAYSVGISDLVSDRKTTESVLQVISSKMNDVKEITDKVHLGILENNSGKTNAQEFESQIGNVLNDATSQTGKIGVKSLDANNRFVIIVKSGSKGSMLNISQMISCLGQQSIDGKRVPYGFDNRTLPHFKKYDDSPEARGFVKNSYISGLTAPELFFHAMGGRMGLIDTAVKSVTWETPIVLINEHGKPIYTEIGRWIDGKLESNVDAVQHFDERNMELLNVNNIYVPTTCENGKVSWEEITAVTRHDPGTKLYEIKTLGGRSVTVTESKSLLIWNVERKGFYEMLTPEICVGDCVPVTAELCEPPTVVSQISLNDYLSKKEFVFGTDFNKAVALMNEDMQTRKKIPTGWWNENNGTKFQLPYTKKSSLQRTTVRCENSNIKNGCIYPYHAQRVIEVEISDTFELNYENGVFIGLFLAEGNVNNSSISITNNNENIRNFVKSWFIKRNIKFTELQKTNHIGGLTTTVRGASSVLCNFINKLVGSGASNKYVHSEAFVASNEYICGLLGGYFSGDGTISKNSVESCSSSKRLTEGISMLCSRIGVFCKVFQTQLKKNNLGTVNIKPSYRISIRSQWGKIFAEKVQLLEDKKQAKLTAIKWNLAHRNFATHNNVVLDPIVEIVCIGVEKHPKMYDLTIPTTLNFGLANGLQVRDTSQTGYIQRRLVKGLEDLKVEYDGTVRNNMGKIVQFTYGEDGVDTTRVENQNIPLVNMSIEDIYMYYDLIGLNDGENKDLLNIYTKETIKRLKAQRASTKTSCKYYIDKLIAFRDELVEKVFKYKNEDAVKTPIAFQHIIQNIQGQLNLTSNSAVDITPLEFIQIAEETFKKIKLMFKPTKMFEIMFFYNLSPKELLIKKRFNQRAVILLMENIILTYKKSIVHPGEMVGVVAGQSIGEPTTQLTLNSFVYETEILVRNSAGEIKCVQIGDFTNLGISTSKKLDYMEDKDTMYAELSEYYEVPSATEDGETVWRRIEAVTKHPVINEDGTNTMLKVTTKGCRELIATKAKSFLKLIDGKIIGIEGKDLKVGDYLPVSKKALDFAEKKQLDLRDILPPSNYIYGSEMLKAKCVVNEHQWWNKHSGKTFVLPYDSRVLSAANTTKVVYHPGYVYATTDSICEYKIPEFIDLDYDFGYLIGAYCAKGCMTKHNISISNNDDEYLKRIENWCAKHNLTTKDGSTICIYSSVLCRIIKKLCGKLSHNKYVSNKIVFSNRECILGFLDAYIGGDGCVNNTIENIQIPSVSHKLLTSVQLMMKNLGVISKMNKPRKVNQIIENLLNMKQVYLLTVCNGQSIKLAQLLNLPIQSKRDRIAMLLERTFKYDYCKSDLTIPNTVDGEIVMELRDGRCMDLEFDKIVSIEEVQNTTEYAYDLTVEDTRNFDCMNGLCIRDTFHLSGVATKSNVTRGVPRIEEILRLTRNPDKPSATVFLKPIDQHEKDKATNYCNMIQHTKLIDVVNTVEICFDPNDNKTKIIKDSELIDQFYEFEKMVDECNESESDETPKSKWVIRMEIDAESLLDKNITMDDIHYAISASHKSDVTCVFSDMNSNNLVFRIRLNASVFNKGKKKGVAESLDQSDEIYLIKNFQDNVLNNIVLRGISGVENVNPRMLKDMVVKEDSKYVRKDMWILDTVGSNLKDLFTLDFIDYTRTYSNDIREMYDFLGIEAARQNILNEFNEVMEASDAYVNYHHLSILCDRMTVKAELVPMFRSGIMNDDIGPIAKGTYEMHTEMFLDASRHGDFDQMRGVSANVMCGQPGYYGTNAFSLMLDMKAIENMEDTAVIQENARQNLDDHFANIGEDAKCDINKIDIDNNVKNIKIMDMGDCNDDYSLF
jgi:DNA-directed RNA polymerase beta' subunit